MSGIMNSFFKVSEWIMRFLMVNIIWLLFNFPIIYFVLGIFEVGSTEELYMIIITIIILMPFIFFPATTAMFAVVRRWIMKTDEGRLLFFYWKFYKENYLRSMIGGIFYVLLWTLWIVNYSLSNVKIGSGIFYFYLAITIFLIAFTSYFFADTVHFEVNLFHSLRKVLFMTLFKVHYTLGAFAAAGIVLFIIYQIYPLFLFLFIGSLVAYIYFFAYYQIYLKAQDVD